MTIDVPIIVLDTVMWDFLVVAIIGFILVWIVRFFIRFIPF